MARHTGTEVRSLSRASFERAVPAGDRILLDTSVVIAYLDRSATTSEIAAHLLDRLVGSGRNPALLSMVTVTEILVRPAQTGDPAHRATALEFLRHFPGMSLREVDFAVAEHAAALRGRFRLSIPDALVVATGLVAGAGTIVSNDRAWSRLPPGAIGANVVLLDDHLPFTA